MTEFDEQKRLDSLRRYEVLDTAAEKVFDDLTRLATAICGTPISLVSLVDEDRQWFKSRTGLDAEQTPRDQAFCAHAIKENRPFIVEDATQDDRFVDNPLVTGDPNIRFYAGLPLVVEDGSALGTLCVIDRKPRKLTPAQVEALLVLRDAVVSHLELRKTMRDNQAMRQLLPVCAWCGNIKDENPDTGEIRWLSLDKVVKEHSSVTHGICPSCTDNMLEERRGGGADARTMQKKDD